MKTSNLFLSLIMITVLSTNSVFASDNTALGQNAALRYWSAFAQMHDATITTAQIKELNGILDGTAPYDDSRYENLVEMNRKALDTMARGTALANCDWGLDYELGSETPVDFVEKAAALARLNVLYVFHLQAEGDKEGEIRALIAGLHFSRDIANGGSLFATLVAKDSLIKHFRAIAFVLHADSLPASQRLTLQQAVNQLGASPLNWRSAVKREMAILSEFAWPSAVPAASISQAYLAALDNPSALAKLEELIESLPPQPKGVIPNPKRVLAEKQDLVEKLQEIRAKLQ